MPNPSGERVDQGIGVTLPARRDGAGIVSVLRHAGYGAAARMAGVGLRWRFVTHAGLPQRQAFLFKLLL